MRCFLVVPLPVVVIIQLIDVSVCCGMYAMPAVVCCSVCVLLAGFAPTWDELFRTLAAADPYGRQTSIHNGPLLYNHSMPYITHVSLQGQEPNTPAIRALRQAS
jgi:hypothetical protein